MIRRILVKGASGAGKSTLGSQLAARLDLPWVELDSLHHGPNWSAASATELQARVLATLDDDRGWVVDGNYDSKLGPLLWDRAQLITGLDLPLTTKLLRLARRTAGRLLRNKNSGMAIEKRSQVPFGAATPCCRGRCAAIFTIAASGPRNWPAGPSCGCAVHGRWTPGFRTSTCAEAARAGGDRWHPNAAGYALLAQRRHATLEPLL